MAGWIPWAVIAVLAGLSALYLRGERTAVRRRAAEHVAALGQLVEEVGALRAALVTSGAVERPAKPPPGDPLAGVPLERPTSSAARAAEAFRSRTTRPGGIGAMPGNERDKGGEP